MTTPKTAAQIKEELAALRASYQDTAKAEFYAHVSALFTKWPQLHSIAFPCFRNYFCDGDPCSYYARYEDYYLAVNGYGDAKRVTGQLGQEGDNLLLKARKTLGYPASPNPDYDPTAEQCVNEIDVALRVLDSDLYEDIFGDNVLLMITREGITTTDFSDHD